MHAHFPVHALLNGELSEEATRALFSAIGFSDQRNALERVRKIGAIEQLDHQKFLEILPNILFALSTCSDADSALINFERFILSSSNAVSRMVLDSSPRHLEILMRVFSTSQYLSEIILYEPSAVETLLDPAKFSAIKDHDQIYHELSVILSHCEKNDPLLCIHRYYKRELLRIGTGDLTAVLDLTTVTKQLSTLADVLIRVALELSCQKFNIDPRRFIILGMGKLGGEELNYSSDIDLLFLSEQDDPDLIRAGQYLIDLLTRRTNEGFLYRVDMRLRPWGRAGALVTTIEGYSRYLETHAKNWEKQALLKARPIAGDITKGNEFFSRITEIIYHLDPNEVKKNVYQMKTRTEQYLLESGRGWGEIKLGEGSIRDVEFVTQYLELIHGGKNTHLRKRSSLQAIRRLHTYGFISTAEFRVLTDGYIFLRTIEHLLQLMHYQQTHSLPDDRKAIIALSRRLGYDSREEFLEKYEQHSLAIRQIYEKFLADRQTPVDIQHHDAELKPFVQKHIDRMSLDYVNAFTTDEIRIHARLAEKINAEDPSLIHTEKISPTHWKVSIVALDFMGELSIFCGLFFLYGLNIQSGDVFTYLDNKNGRKDEKIVDVFIVEETKPDPDWNAFEQDIKKYLKLIQNNQLRIARSQLAIRIGSVFEHIDPITKPMLPIELSFDNTTSNEFTIILINTADTIGFLYEFTNALSLMHIYIDRMVINTEDLQVEDLIYVGNDKREKITDPQEMQKLRSTAVLIKHFTHLLPKSPNPAKALLHFRDLLTKLFQQDNWAQEILTLERPQVIDNLATLLGVSDFLWDDFIRMQYHNLFPVIQNTEDLAFSRSKEDLSRELSDILKPIHDGPQIPGLNDEWKRLLNEFKDREMFRIDMRHILGLTDEFWDFSAELTDLSEVIINVAYHLTFQDLRMLYGTPRLDNGEICQMAVVALGKCGGRELGFASDIEVMFIYNAEGSTDGSERILNSIFFEKLVSNFLGAIKAKHEGIFHIDMRLRPYGNAGSLAVALSAFKKYFGPDGTAWPYEKQSLVKLRPIAGDEELGHHIKLLRDEYLYSGTPFDVISMRAMREQQVRHLTKAGIFNAKYSPGGLLDIEYLVQGLQITHGNKDLAVRNTNIREAMQALHDHGHLEQEDFIKLRKAHTFLRWLIDSMRVVRGNSKDVNVPQAGTEEFGFLCRRLRFGNDHQKLIDTLARVQADVVALNRRLLPAP